MAPRPYWKGYLKLSLVSCPIALYPAIDASERVYFRQVNKQTGNRLRQQLVDTVTGEVVEAEEKGRGYELGENQFLVVKEEEWSKRAKKRADGPTVRRRPLKTRRQLLQGAAHPRLKRSVRCRSRRWPPRNFIG
jgi:non-homologous end joining protein Ku